MKKFILLFFSIISCINQQVYSKNNINNESKTILLPLHKNPSISLDQNIYLLNIHLVDSHKQKELYMSSKLLLGDVTLSIEIPSSFKHSNDVVKTDSIIIDLYKLKAINKNEFSPDIIAEEAYVINSQTFSYNELINNQTISLQESNLSIINSLQNLFHRFNQKTITFQVNPTKNISDTFQVIEALNQHYSKEFSGGGLFFAARIKSNTSITFTLNTNKPMYNIFEIPYKIYSFFSKEKDSHSTNLFRLNLYSINKETNIVTLINSKHIVEPLSQAKSFINITDCSNFDPKITQSTNSAFQVDHPLIFKKNT